MRSAADGHIAGSPVNTKKTSEYTMDQDDRERRIDRREALGAIARQGPYDGALRILRARGKHAETRRETRAKTGQR